MNKIELAVNEYSDSSYLRINGESLSLNSTEDLHRLARILGLAMGGEVSFKLYLECDDEWPEEEGLVLDEDGAWTSTEVFGESASVQSPE